MFQEDAHLYDFDRNKFLFFDIIFWNVRGRPRNELKIDDRLIQDEKELLNIWKYHYEELYTPKYNPMFDKEFKPFVETKVHEFESRKNKIQMIH